MTTPAIIRLIASGAIGALGLGSYLYIRGWLRLQRRRARLERHLRRLRRLTSQLLNAFNQLLTGDTPGACSTSALAPTAVRPTTTSGQRSTRRYTAASVPWTRPLNCTTS